MTDTDVNVDLDEYTEILAGLNREIEAYGAERRSLEKLTNSLVDLHASNERVFSGVEHTVRTGSSVLQELRDLELSKVLGDIGERYETHQRSLESISGSIQQIVHEQQRSALEMLQNAQHNKQALEHYTKSVRAASSAQEAAYERITQQLDTVVTQIGSVKTTLSRAEKQLQVLRVLVIVAMVLVLAVGVAVIAI